MTNLLFVGLGGFVGAVSRFLVNQYVYKHFDKPWLPYGTLTVNILGCLLIGYLHGFFQAREIISINARAFIFIGFLGSFTTYSTFGYEAFGFARQGQVTASMSYIILHLIIGLLAVWAGDGLARLF